MMKERVQYNREFKSMVVSLLENGVIKSIEECRRIFNIGSSMTVNKWVRKEGKEDLLPKLKLRTLNEEMEQLKINDPQLYETITKTLDSKKQNS